MIKGINKQVVEITQEENSYFERILFFVKPEYSTISEKQLRERAQQIGGKAGPPPAMKIRNRRLFTALGLIGSAGVGAALSALITSLI